MYELNLKDRKILHELDINARQSLNQIAKKVGLSKEVVNYRINRLIEQGIIKGFYARIDTSKLGLTIYRLFLRMQDFTPKQEQQFIEFVKKHKGAGFFVRVEGRFDFNILYWAKSTREYYNFWKELKSKFGKNIENQELHIFNSYESYQKGFLIGKKDLTIPFFQCGLNEKVETDQIDEKLLNILAGEARTSLIEIAKKLGITDKATSYRIKKLEKSGIINSYGVQLDLEKIGYHYYKLHLFLKNFSEERFKELKDFAVVHPNIVYTEETLGGPDFEIELYLPNKQDYYNFLAELRYKFSDIIRDFETIYYPEAFKFYLYPVET